MGQRLLTLFLLLLAGNGIFAQNRLATHNEVRQAVTGGRFQQKSGTTITADDKAITATEAKTWLNLYEGNLPSDGRLPWYAELVPNTPQVMCYGEAYPICTNSSSSNVSGLYTTSGTWLYSLQYLNNPATAPRQRIGGPFWVRSGSSSNITSPLGRAGKWGCYVGGIRIPTGRWYGVTTMVNNFGTNNKNYYIGVAGDYAFRVIVDGAVSFEIKMPPNPPTGLSDTAFTQFYVYPVSLSPGTHFITFEAVSYATNRGAIAGEIYDNTEYELIAARDYSNLRLLFSTKDLTNQPLCGSQYEICKSSPTSKMVQNRCDSGTKTCKSSVMVASGRYLNTYQYKYSDGTTRDVTVEETGACNP
jgi:hypothetical protein